MSLKLSSILATLLALFILVFESLEVLPDFLIHKLEWIGDRSYSIYLVHMPLLYLAKYSPITQIGNSERRVIQSTIAIVASILLGAISYSKIENKYRNRGKNNITGFKTVFKAMTVSLVLPLVLFLSMERGFKEKYWGLDKNIVAPPVAWNLDPDCNRLTGRPKPCLYNFASSKRTVLLIGDSHAAHISQAIIDAARLENWNSAVWTHTGCHVQFTRRIKDEVSDACLKQNKEIVKWVKSNKPSAIIVSQFVYSDSSQDDLRYALAKLHSFVPYTLLIENTPVFPDEKKFMVAQPIIILPTYKPPKDFQLSMMQTKDKKASDILANWARNNGVLTMNFDSLFCKKDVCTRFSDKGWLYADDDHFSVLGAELTIPQLRAFLNQF